MQNPDITGGQISAQTATADPLPAIRSNQWILGMAGVAATCALWEFVDQTWLAHSATIVHYILHVGGVALPVAIGFLAAFQLIAGRERTLHSQIRLARHTAFVSSLLNAQEEERRTLAYDLHDGLTQYIMASHSHIEAFQAAQKEADVETAEAELEQGLHYLNEAVLESRRLINGLRSLALDDLGLVGALDQLLAEEKARAIWQQAELIQNVGERRFERALETTVFRVAQEAVTNARKHAQTDRLQIRLNVETRERPGQEQLVLEVQDWGRGFVPENMMKDYSHVGLQGMMERVHLMDGTYELKSVPGHGTVIRAVLPVPQVQPPAPEGTKQ